MEPDREEFYRSVDLGFADVATNGSIGRVRDDAVAQAVTEGHGGSSCGFLLHFVACRLGVRERWVNRGELKSEVHPGYRSGENLSLLFQATWGGKHGPACARRLGKGELFKHGDFLIMEDPEKTNDDHVCIAAKDFDGDVFYSYDGGQRGAHGKPEDFRFCDRTMRQNRNGLWQVYERGVWGKQVWATISLPELIEEAEAHELLTTPEEPRAWLAHLMGVPVPEALS